MATIIKEFDLQLPLLEVWRALKDFGNPHLSLAKGFVADTLLNGTIRTITFANGQSARERLVAADDTHYRLVYSAFGEGIVHHNASWQLQARDSVTTHVTWITDMLPDELRIHIESMMSEAVTAIRATLESANCRSGGTDLR